MSQARFTRPKNRLAARVNVKGISREVAVSWAKVNVESIREPTMAYVDTNLELIVDLLARQTAGTAPVIEPLYDASNAVAGTAGVFGYTALGQAAFSLCELLAHLEETGEWNGPAVKVHVDGMRMLRQFAPGKPNEVQDVILNNLARLLTHLAPKADPGA